MLSDRRALCYLCMFLYEYGGSGCVGVGIGTCGNLCIISMVAEFVELVCWWFGFMFLRSFRWI